jgi:hypothetical protein
MRRTYLMPLMNEEIFFERIESASQQEEGLVEERDDF